MSLTNTNDGFTMPVVPMGGGYGNGGSGLSGWGGDSFIWLIILFLFFAMSGAWGNNGYGNGGGSTPYVVNNDIQRGFDQASLSNGINGIASDMCNGFSNVQQSLCNGFAGVNSTVSNGFAQAEISNNARQIADMQQQFASQTAITSGMTGLQSQLAQCCCDNRAATNDLKYVISTEACADRQSVNDALRDVIASNTANTQAILDKLCQQEIDALKTENANLQTQLNLANLGASQNAQTATILADNAAQTAQLLPKAPVAAYVVPSPYAYQNQCGCGCGCNVA